MKKSDSTMLSVFLSQESARSEKEAKEKLKEAKREDSYLGGRVIPPDRQRKKLWLIQACFEDDGGKPPQGMARLQIPLGGDQQKVYGITLRAS